jgi:hypothetical protein
MTGMLHTRSLIPAPHVEVQRLERLLRRKTFEIEVVEKALAAAQAKIRTGSAPGGEPAPRAPLKGEFSTSREHIHAIAHLNARPDKAEELGALLTSLLEPTRQEPGCIRFDLQQNRATPTACRCLGVV